LPFVADDGIVVVDTLRTTLSDVEGPATSMRRGDTVAPAPELMTVDDYFNTPETVKPMELVFGALRVADAPSPRHQSAVVHLFRALDAHVRARGLGEVWLAPLDVVLDERKALIVQPDLFFISNDRGWIVKDRVRGAPDLVVEVLSPNPRIGQTEERVGWFGDYGVRECWLVHQHRRDLTVIDLATKDQHVFAALERIKSRVLPEFSETLDEILANGIVSDRGESGAS
jgi:Uma2 family endonuclease